MPKPPTIGRSVVRQELIKALPQWTMAVDPGESVGICLKGRTRGIRADHALTDHYFTLTLTPEQAVDKFGEFCLRASHHGGSPTLIIEEYRIYPDKAMAHAGKTVPTAECIGMFKYVARRMKARVIEQPASIKQTTAAMLRTRGIQLTGGTRHAKDAELHMWYPVLRSQYQEPTGRKRKAS